MELQYKPDFSEACKYWDAFWQSEIIDRPCIAIIAPQDGCVRAPAPPYMAGSDGQYEAAIGQFDHWAATTFFGGEAIPFFDVSFGPDQFSAFIGAKLDSSKKEFGTTWSVPFVNKWEEVLPLRLRADNPYWQNMLKFVHIAAEVGEGKFLVGVPDLHSNFDCLTVIRGPEKLMIDIVDIPEVIDQAMASVRHLYSPIYKAIYLAGKMTQRGSIGWAPTYCKGRFATIQCDFITMLSPAMARRFVIPALAEEAAYLDHAVYHLDGPGALVHLDDILAIPDIDVIQWVPGAGQSPRVKWVDLYKKIQAAGKGLQIYCSPEDVKVLHKELRPEGVVYCVGYTTDGPEPNMQRDAEALISWLKSHM